MQPGNPISYPQNSEMNRDSVNHPAHYQSERGVECIAVAECLGFNLGNAVKYLWRHKHKNGPEDLQKAVWYLERELCRVGNGFTSEKLPRDKYRMLYQLTEKALGEGDYGECTAVFDVLRFCNTGNPAYLSKAIIGIGEIIIYP